MHERGTHASDNGTRAVFWARLACERQAGDSVLHRNGRALFIALLAYSVQGLAIDIHSQKLLWVLLGMAIACRHLSLSDQSVAHDSMVMS